MNQSPSGDPALALTWLKLLAVGVPSVFIAVMAFAVRGPLHHELHTTPSFYVLIAGMSGAVIFISMLIFRLIERIEQRIITQNRHLATLLSFGQKAGSPLQIAGVLEVALQGVLAATPADVAQVWIAHEDELVLDSQMEANGEPFRPGTKLRLGEGLVGIAGMGIDPIITRDLPLDDPCIRTGTTGLGLACYGSFPLRRGEEIVGVLGVASRDPLALTDESELRLLDGISRQLAVAIENARLRECVLDEAVLEERERLARELHDGLAQVLGYVTTQALAVKRLLATGRNDAAREQVTNMENAAREVYGDVRESILGLHSSHDGIVESINSHVTFLRRAAGVRAELHVDDAVLDLALSSHTEIQVARIVQEALNNTRKHASASEVTVNLSVEGEMLVVRVSDDGQGFDLAVPRQTGWPHFGLQSMRERVKALDGTLVIESTPGTGTTIVVNIPSSEVQVRQPVAAHDGGGR